jgi:threonine aldolase
MEKCGPILFLMNKISYTSNMISFECDYNNGMAPKILQAMIDSNNSSQSGYGADDYTLSAIAKIKKAIEQPTSYVSLVCGGTQTNQLVISTLLNRCEGVITVDSGHINVHESGAIEYTGHKVIALKNKYGKLSPDTLKSYMEQYIDSEPKNALVTPKMVYISHPTEIGTLYSKEELEQIRAICDEYHMYLFLDGARLAYAVATPQTDVTLSYLAQLCDAFYIGGTKCGAIAGEAVVLKKEVVPYNFEQMKKQEGALLAKGRLLGLQFDTLFTNNYYQELGEIGIRQALRLKEIFKAKGYQLAWDSPTNQQFIIMDNKKIEELLKVIKFERWEGYDKTQSVVRFCTSWATKDSDLDALEKAL